MPKSDTLRMIHLLVVITGGPLSTMIKKNRNRRARQQNAAQYGDATVRGISHLSHSERSAISIPRHSHHPHSLAQCPCRFLIPDSCPWCPGVQKMCGCPPGACYTRRYL